MNVFSSMIISFNAKAINLNINQVSLAIIKIFLENLTANKRNSVAKQRNSFANYKIKMANIAKMAYTIRSYNTYTKQPLNEICSPSMSLNTDEDFEDQVDEIEHY